MGLTFFAIAGGTTADQKKSDNGLNWTSLGTSATLTGFYNGGLIYYNGALFHIGGTLSSVYKSDVYKSTDNGASWIKIGDLPIGLAEFATVVLNNSIYVIGGRSASSTYSTSVYRSDDFGVTWTNIGTAPYSYSFCSATIWNNEIWYLTGNNGTIVQGKIYKSSDGINWTEVTTLSQRRYKSSFLVFNNQLLMFGGYNHPTTSDLTTKLKDALVSSNGVTWTSVTPPAIVSSTTQYDTLTAPYTTFENNGTIYYLSQKKSDGTVTNWTLSTTTDLITWTETTTDLLRKSQTIASAIVDTTSLSLSASYNSSSSVSVVIDLLPTSMLLTINIASTSSLYVTPELLPKTLSVYADFASQSSVDTQITMLPIVIPLTLICSFNSNSEVYANLSLVSNIVIKGNVSINGVPQTNAKIYIISDNTNSTTMGITDSQGYYEISVVASGYYHIFCVYRDVNGNAYSTLVQPYVYAGEVK